ncbi:MAG: GSCFA domain-containing protein [Bacteroidota bacterium]
MKPFRTEIPPIAVPFQVDHQTRILALGSCFSTEIGQYLHRGKFQVLPSPFGIVYHPNVLARQLHRILTGTPYTNADLFFHDERWHSFDHHGHFSHPDPQIGLHRINQHLAEAHQHLADHNVLLLTLGSTRGFYHPTTDQIVANCHKLPQAHFERRSASPTEIAEALRGALELLWEKHPTTQVVLTVSPVRHLRDGLVDNQRSKARLVLATEQVLTSEARVHYFPAYEMLLDDLRDYRFYARDYCHPSPEAIDYVWERFQQAYCSETTRTLLQRIQKLVTASRHRPFHPGRVAHQRFLRQQLRALTQLEREYPQLDFQAERALFEEHLLI